MVYVKKEGMNEKKERKTFKGKLASISVNSEGVVDEAKKIFKYIDLGFVETKDGKDQWTNIRVSGSDKNNLDLNSEDLKEIKRADELIRDKKPPICSLEYYESVKVPLDEKKQPIMKDGKPVVYTNLRANVNDIKKTFRILEAGAAAPSSSKF